MVVYGVKIIKKILTEHSSKAKKKRGALMKLNGEKWLWEDSTMNDVLLGVLLTCDFVSVSV